MPNRSPVTVAAIHRDDVEVQAARGGENLRLRLSGVDEDEVQAGFVLCSRRAPVPCVTYFDAQLQILDLLEHKAIFTAGYKVKRRRGERERERVVFLVLREREREEEEKEREEKTHFFDPDVVRSNNNKKTFRRSSTSTRSSRSAKSPRCSPRST